MYALIRKPFLRLLSAPTEPPEPPAGSPGTEVVFRASPRLLTVRLIALCLVSSFLVVPLALGMTLAGIHGESGPLFGSALLLVGVLALVALRWFLIRLDWDMRYYIVTDRSLRIRQGALIIRESTYTFANVQNVSVHQGPLDRLLGLASVRIDTAGGGAAQQGQNQGMAGHHGVLYGIENAPEVRDRILALLRAYRDAGLGDRDDRGGGPPATGLTPYVALLGEIRDALRRARSAATPKEIG